jgi:hypothetical protein
LPHQTPSNAIYPLFIPRSHKTTPTALIPATEHNAQHLHVPKMSEPSTPILIFLLGTTMGAGLVLYPQSQHNPERRFGPGYNPVVRVSNLAPVNVDGPRTWRRDLVLDEDSEMECVR